jgi:hypothetical protein
LDFNKKCPEEFRKTQLLFFRHCKPKNIFLRNIQTLQDR